MKSEAIPLLTPQDAVPSSPAASLLSGGFAAGRSLRSRSVVGRIAAQFSMMRDVADDTRAAGRTISVGFAAAEFESLDFDMCDSKLALLDEDRHTAADINKTALLRWLLVSIIGLVTGVIAFLIDLSTKALCDFKFGLIRKLARTYDLSPAATRGGTAVWTNTTSGYLVPFAVWMALSVGFVLIANILVVYVEPLAAGSGIPEIKAFLNGVRIPRAMRLKTLFAKAVGVVFAVAGGLPVGKEGPMIHSGAIVGAGIPTMSSTLLGFDFSRPFSVFRLDSERRDMISCGAAAGVAAAFGAPVGGVLFSLEEGCTHWNQNLTWRMFFCSLVASFALNVLRASTDTTSASSSRSFYQANGLLAFGEISGSYTLQDLPIFVLMGALGGILGALFNLFNLLLTRFRARFTRKNGVVVKWRRLLDGVVVAFIVAVLSFLIYAFGGECLRIGLRSDDYSAGIVPKSHDFHAFVVSTSCQQPVCALSSSSKPTANPNHNVSAVDDSYQVDVTWCPTGRYNGIATFFMTQLEAVVRSLLHLTAFVQAQSLLLWGTSFYLLACLSYGTPVPSGLFLPCLAIGGAFGRLFGQTLQVLFPSATIDLTTYVLIGGAALLGGVVRMTLSLTVIILEATGDMIYGLPVMLTLMVAKWVGDIFNSGIYDMHLELRRVPFVEAEAEHAVSTLPAGAVMSSPVTSLPLVSTVKSIVRLLDDHPHGAYPVVSHRGRLVGVVLAQHLQVFLYTLFDGGVDAVAELTSRDFILSPVQRAVVGKAFLEIVQQVHSSPYHRIKVNLSLFAHTSPMRVYRHTRVRRLVPLFRALGLRHVVVTNADNEPIGMVTRKDICHLHVHNEDSTRLHPSASRFVIKKRRKWQRRDGGPEPEEIRATISVCRGATHGFEESASSSDSDDSTNESEAVPFDP